MAGKGIGQPGRRGELRTEQTRPQEPQRHPAPLARHRADAEAFVAGEKRLQFYHILRELPLVARERATQRVRDALVRSGRTAEPQIDTPRKQRLERSDRKSTRLNSSH